MQAKFLIAAKVLALAVALFALAPAPPLRAQDDMDISVFYDELEQHGRWFTHPRYGDVWSPDVDEEWRPYSRGNWIYTDDHGWYWEAEEPWGWGPFHYGRWIMDDEFGWVWIPGTEWGPAWVAWRYSDEYVGWAPLPPEAEWYDDRGLTFSATYYDEPRFAPLWIFVEPRYLVVRGLYRHALPRSRNVFALGRTRWHTDYRFVNRRVFNTGFDVRRFERITQRPLVRTRVLNSDSPRTRGFRGNDRGTLHAYRPRLVVKANLPRPPRLVDPPRREFRRQDGGRPPTVRPGFTPPDQGKGGLPRERSIAAPPGGGPNRDNDNTSRKGFRGPDDNQRKDFARPPQDRQLKQHPTGEASGGPPPDSKKQEFKRQPRAGAQTPPGEPGGGDRRQFQQKQFQQPQADRQPPARQRVEGGSPRPQQFKQQAPPPQRDDRNGQGERNKKDRKDDQPPR